MPIHKAYILLGSNMGKREQYLSQSAQLVAQNCGNIIKESSVYETAAWGNTQQADFLNRVILIETKFSPDNLMKALLHIETGLGRIRSEKYGPRTIDLDILFYDELIFHSSVVTLPHPSLQDRRFVLVPLVELSPRKIHPVYRKTMTRLLQECTDLLEVKKV